MALVARILNLNSSLVLFETENVIVKSARALAAEIKSSRNSCQGPVTRSRDHNSRFNAIFCFLTMASRNAEGDHDALARQLEEDTFNEGYHEFLEYHRQLTSIVSKAWTGTEEKTPAFPMFRRVDKTGVIFATALARKHGFTAEDPSWANMGQGAPETGHIDGAPPRKFDLHIPPDEVEYAPTTGIQELREKVADYYNFLYRQGKESKYSADNVCVVPGGRAGITRVMSILGETQCGFFNPDYTAYEVS